MYTFTPLKSIYFSFPLSPRSGFFWILVLEKWDDSSDFWLIVLKFLAKRDQIWTIDFAHFFWRKISPLSLNFRLFWSNFLRGKSIFIACRIRACKVSLLLSESIFLFNTKFIIPSQSSKIILCSGKLQKMTSFVFQLKFCLEKRDFSICFTIIKRRRASNKILVKVRDLEKWEIALEAEIMKINTKWGG